MILPGNKFIEQITSEEVTNKKLECIKKSDTREVQGSDFVQGGQSEVEDREKLN